MMEALLGVQHASSSRVGNQRDDEDDFGVVFQWIIPERIYKHIKKLIEALKNLNGHWDAPLPPLVNGRPGMGGSGIESKKSQSREKP
jgi:hypothetical protein